MANGDIAVLMAQSVRPHTQRNPTQTIENEDGVVIENYTSIDVYPPLAKFNEIREIISKENAIWQDMKTQRNTLPSFRMLPSICFEFRNPYLVILI